MAIYVGKSGKAKGREFVIYSGKSGRSRATLAARLFHGTVHRVKGGVIVVARGKYAGQKRS